jgi:hypothetical protein
MNNRIVATMVLVCLFLPITNGWPQTRRFPSNVTLDPCPGGAGSAQFEPDIVPNSLETLIRPADLIVIGSVVNNLPAVLRDRTQAMSIETHSVISVDQILSGSLPSNSHTIVLVQYGGNVPPCRLIAPDDPIVSAGEKFVFFLQRDERPQPVNTTGSPRFVIVGIWSGKVKIDNSKIHFPTQAHPGLRKYDNSDLKPFTDRINAVLHPLPPPSPVNPAPIPVPSSSPFARDPNLNPKRP